MKRWRILVWPLLAGLLSACQLRLLAPQASVFYQVASRQYPENSPVAYIQGRSYLDQGQFEAALREFKRYSELAPEDPRVWVAMGQCELELGRYRSAEGRFRRAQSLRDDTVATAGLIAAILMDGRLEEAQSLLDTAAGRFRASAPLRRVAGDVALMAGRAEQALLAYEESLALAPGQPDLRARVRELRDFLTKQP
jgi:Flp pilus assembly protein TadD